MSKDPVKGLPECCQLSIEEAEKGSANCVFCKGCETGWEKNGKGWVEEVE